MRARSAHGDKPDRGGIPVRRRLLERLPLDEQHRRPAGIPTAVLEGGQGPPMVLLHGQGEFAATWMRVVPDLAAAHRLVVPDLPGHGASGTGEQTLDTNRVLAWLDELVAATCETPPVVVGHLLGGAVAARYAATHPDRVHRLVLVDSLGLGWYRPALRFGLAMAGFVVRPTPASRERLFDQCFLDLAGMRDDMGRDLELLEAYALERARGPELQAALSALMPRIGIRPVPASDLAGIAVPVGLIWGRHDRQVRLSTAQAASERYGWPLHVIDDAADDPAVEQPRAFLAVLQEVLGTSDAALHQETTP